MGPIEELLFFDEGNCWHDVFMKIRIDAMMQHDFSLKVSKKPEFKNRNRYGDVSPYDYSRICLVKNDIDYINASLVRYKDANRAYILTQGPLPGTSGHFWLMIWEQKSRAILMLNKIVEKGHIKCHQYFPTGCEGEEDVTFDDVSLKVTFLEELESNHDFTIRVFQLQNTETMESVRVMQFHYIAWPDFGVPESPSAFLDFLFAVRSFGVLDDPDRPPVIHCSAGIGRSGTFCLADTCLILIEKEGSLENLKVLDTLMEMRKYRMGLIQTPEQLRFSYLAIVEGATRIDCLPAKKFEEEEDGCCQDVVECDDGEEYYNDAMVEEAKNVNVSSSTEPNDEDGDEEEEEEEEDFSLPPVPPRSFESLTDRTLRLSSAAGSVSEDDHAVGHQNGRLPNGGNEVVAEEEEEEEEDSLPAASTGVGGQDQGTPRKRRRMHEERVKKTQDMVEKMKLKQQRCESDQQSGYGFFLYGGISVAVAFLGFAAYKLMSYGG